MPPTRIRPSLFMEYSIDETKILLPNLVNKMSEVGNVNVAQQENQEKIIAENTTTQ